MPSPALYAKECVHMDSIIKQISVCPKDLELSSYEYPLPGHLIGLRPCEKRDQSRLLVCYGNSDEVIHTRFDRILSFLPHDSLLVFNESRVFPCRLRGRKSTGGKCEMIVLSLEESPCPVLINCRGRKKTGDRYLFAGNLQAKIVGKRQGGIFVVELTSMDLKNHLYRWGDVPLPSYIREGVSDEKDKEDYQTVFATKEGSVAAPTAGLHFTKELMERLKQKVQLAFVSLHTGPGTFLPVKTENIPSHFMYPESFFVDEQNREKIKKAWDSGKKIIAVGTTSLRVLESCCDFRGQLIFPSFKKKTDLFLYPGVPIRVVDGLITNFHLPKSTLLMLVSALLGRERVLDLYGEAVEKGYRFFSYGDAMFVSRKRKCLL